MANRTVLIPQKSLGGGAGGGAVGEKATFGVGIGQVQTIGQDLTNHYMVRQPDGGGTLIEVLGNCKSPGSLAGAPLYLDILVSRNQGESWASIFPAGAESKLVLPVDDVLAANRTKQVTVTAFAAEPDNALAPGDWLRIDLLEDSDETSRDIEVVVRWG